MKVAKANVPGMRQNTQYTCMAASIAACIRSLSEHITEEEVNKVLGAAPLRGARWEEALATLQYFGFRGNLVVPSHLNEVRDWTDKGNPVIIAWNPEGRPWSHASVVYDVDDENVYVMDSNVPNPDKTSRIVPIDDFYSKWGEKIGDMLVVRRPALFVSRENMTVTAKKKKKTDSLNTMKGIERQKAIESGTYFQTGAGRHHDKKDKVKHKKDQDWMKEGMQVQARQIAIAYYESR